MKKGYFITLEGTEGSGKSSVARLLQSYYTSKGIDVVLTKEPGGVDIAEQIRNVILNKGNKSMDAYTELLLYIAARRQHLVEKVIPALDAGKVVICDRFTDSTAAYQGYARGIDLSIIDKLNEIAVDTRKYPVDMTLLLDVDPEIGLSRIATNQRETNRLDVESLAFHRKVRNGYLELAKAHPERIRKINANTDLYSVFLKAQAVITKELSAHFEQLKVVESPLKKILVFVGPSGSGKTTIIDMLNKRGYPELVSHTTRQKRKGDIEGKNYFFVTQEEFEREEYVETVTYAGNMYGLARSEINKKLNKHNVVVIACAIEGALAIKEAYPEETKLIFLDVPLAVCKQRMELRGDSQESVNARLKNIENASELDNGAYCDIVLLSETMTPEKIVRSIESMFSQKKILVFIGPSGSGKTAVVRGLNKDGIPVVITHTTRKPRHNEINGVDYHFVTEKEFMKIDKIEYAQYAGSYYGVSRSEIESKLHSSDIIAVITSVEGGLAIRNLFPQYANLIYVSVSEAVARQRMALRGEKQEIIDQRIAHIAKEKEFDNWRVCDFVLDNNRSINDTFSVLKPFVNLLSKCDLRETEPQRVDVLVKREKCGLVPNVSRCQK